MADEDEDQDEGGSANPLKSMRPIDFGDPGLDAGAPTPTFNSLKTDFGVIPTLDTGTGFTRSVGTGLGAAMAPFEGSAYVFGGKSASTGFDCSGLAHQIVMSTMVAANRQAGGDIYNMAEMERMLGQPAAYQITSVADRTGGGFIVNASNINQLKPGMMLGITRNSVPDFAKGRPEGISHVGVICVHNGAVSVAESGGHGVAYTPLSRFLLDPTVARVHAVDPFAATTPDGQKLIASTFVDKNEPAIADSGAPKDKPRETADATASSGAQTASTPAITQAPVIKPPGPIPMAPGIGLVG